MLLRVPSVSLFYKLLCINICKNFFLANSQEGKKKLSLSHCGLEFMLLHILSGRPAAEVTYNIWTQDQQINEVYPF